jgi:hypothetical protein
MQVLHGRLGVERHHGVLELVRAQLRGHVGRHQDERVANGDLAAPHDRRGVLHRQAVPAAGVRERHQVRLSNQVGLRGAGRHDVELVAADHGDADADRAGRPVTQPEPVPLGEEAAVRGADRLLQADDQSGRLVVVVLTLDGVCHEVRGIAEAPALADARHNEEEAPLGAGRRPDRRLDDGNGVRGVLEPLMLRHEAELHLESDGHAIRRT